MIPMYDRSAQFFVRTSLALSFAILLSAPIAEAYVASSSSYRLEEDSINIAGGLSTSTNYRLEDTVGEDASGTSTSATYKLKAGYQQMRDVYLAVTAPGNITLAPNIPTTGGGTANGQGAWTVITDSPSGYTAAIRASAAPALVSGVNNIPNYVPSGADPDFAFSTPAASARFGFTPEGTDIATRFRDNGIACNAGAGDTANACWDAIAATDKTFSSRTSANHPSGIATTIKFRAVSGASNTQAAGVYTATATITVLAR